MPGTSPSPLDAGAMDAAAQQLEGEHDFAAFRAADAEPPRSTVAACSRAACTAARCSVYRIERRPS